MKLIRVGLCSQLISFLENMWLWIHCFLTVLDKISTNQRPENGPEAETFSETPSHAILSHPTETEWTVFTDDKRAEQPSPQRIVIREFCKSREKGKLSLLHILHHSSWWLSLVEFRNVPGLDAVIVHVRIFIKTQRKSGSKWWILLW